MLSERHIYLRTIIAIVLELLCEYTRAQNTIVPCDNGILLTKSFPEAEFSVNFTSPPCPWIITGEVDCNVQLSCSVDLPPGKNGNEDDFCEGSHLIVTDGMQGMKRFCGRTTITGLRASENLRDLFLNFVRDDAEDSENWGGKYTGVFCEAKCANKKIKGNFLPLDTVMPKRDASCVCGIGEINKRDIVGLPESSLYQENAWVAAVVLAGTKKPFCGASVLNDRFLISAAHCFRFNPKLPKRLEALIRVTDLDARKESDWEEGDGTLDDEDSVQRFKISEIFIHPLYNKKQDFDFALLYLNKKIDFRKTEDPALPLCIPPPAVSSASLHSEQSFLSTKRLSVTGWTDAPKSTGKGGLIAQTLDARYMSLAHCQEMYPGKVTSRMICTGFEQDESYATQKNSGCSLTTKNAGNQTVQYGIGSWNELDANVDVYSRVSDAIQWINFLSLEKKAKWCKDTLQ